MSCNEVIIRGGIGNQLFGLLYAYKLLLKNNNVSLNLTNYSLIKRKDRKFVLEVLLPTIYEKFDLNLKKRALLNYFYAKLIEYIFIKNKKDRLPGDKSFFIKYWPNRCIHSGYFQKFDDSELEKICLKLLKSDLQPYLKDERSRYLALHIRRGDYLLKKHNIHGIIEEKDLYNETSKQLLKGDFEGIRIFSDSPELININNFKTLHKNVVLDKGGDPIKVFRRMTNHQGLIASNSSFSLWAGILGDIKIFSIPFYWMKDVKSSILGLDFISRYNCKI